MEQNLVWPAWRFPKHLYYAGIGLFRGQITEAYVLALVFVDERAMSAVINKNEFSREPVAVTDNDSWL